MSNIANDSRVGGEVPGSNASGTAEDSVVVGIDLGTTNSAVAVVRGGHPELIPLEDGSHLLPSVVGLAPDGTLLVGHAARNQYVVFPERTIASVKRRMGEDVRLTMGEQSLRPEEVSALILRHLKRAAEAHLGHRVQRAVITVPAYFSDAQRTATREAGQIAGLKVERIVAEPTAAALCYAGSGDTGRERKLLVYDLGGGTFDVSVVRLAGELVEVIASHGNTSLGGDDMDASLQAELTTRFDKLVTQGAEQVGNDARATARLLRASEEAKIRLSSEPFARVLVEHLVSQDDVGQHLDVELDRRQYEGLIEELVRRTNDSVHVALREAALTTSALDSVVLVGGATRTPLVSERLFQLTGHMPRADVNPDEAVALGAALLGARIAGHKTDSILVDVSPFSFGTSYLGELAGLPWPHCYKPIIRRNSTLPMRQTEVFYTAVPGQTTIDVHVFQGEEEDARRNIPLGRFSVEGLDARAAQGTPLLFEMRLNLDGILDVEVTEKATGLKKSVTIENAMKTFSEEEISQARARIEAMFGEDEGDEYDEVIDTDAVDAGQDNTADAEVVSPDQEDRLRVPPPPSHLEVEQQIAWTTAADLLSRAQGMLRKLDEADRAEVSEAVSGLAGAMESVDWSNIAGRSSELGDMLFYLE